MLHKLCLYGDVYSGGLLVTTYPEFVSPPTTIVLKPTEMEPCPYFCCARSPSFRHWLFLNSAIVLEKVPSCMPPRM